ncbi:MULTISPECIES: hypothetical protein [Pseudomonas]|nr:hypothetical protein RK21_02074 [Pseudomonas plecoglossicida]
MSAQRSRGQMIHSRSLRKLEGTPQLNDNLKQLLRAEVVQGNFP